MLRHCFFTNFNLLLAVTSFVTSTRSTAEEVGHREECRQTMVAEYFNQYDSTTRISELNTLMKQSLARYEKEIISAKKKYQAEQKLYDESDFTEIGEDQLTALKNHYEFTKHHIEHLRKSTKYYETVLPDVRRDLKKLTELTRPLFRVVMHSERDGAPYPFEIEFEKACPKYRYTCPLTSEQANSLRKLMAARQEFQEGCKAYLNYSGYRQLTVN